MGEAGWLRGVRRGWGREEGKKEGDSSSYIILIAIEDLFWFLKNILKLIESYRAEERSRGQNQHMNWVFETTYPRNKTAMIN